MVSSNRQILLDDMARAEQWVPELADVRDRLMRYVSELRQQLDSQSAWAGSARPHEPSFDFLSRASGDRSASGAD